MGFVMAIFMNAMQFKEMDITKNIRQSYKTAFKNDLGKMTSMAKGFAKFGFLYGVFEC